VGRLRHGEEHDADGDLLGGQDDTPAGHRYRPADLIVRVGAGIGIRAGETVAVAVDTARTYLFDRTGHRITSSSHATPGPVIA
jgi:hypothetical protein